MKKSKNDLKVLKKAGRRTGFERREYSWEECLPERRSGGDRRDIENTYSALIDESWSLKEGNKDRRVFRRFKALDGAYAMLENDSSKMGQILDISKKGLAFNFIDDGKNAIEESVSINVFLADTGYRLKEIQGKIITDFNLSNHTHPGAITMRRLGVEFVSLSDNQQSKLFDFILNYTYC